MHHGRLAVPVLLAVPVVVGVPVLAVVAALLAPAAPASAHPFGPPPTAWITHDDDEVGVVWDAAYDDLVVIGERLDVLAEGTADRYREAETQVAPPRSEEEALETSPRLREYVTERIAVHQGDERCEPRMALDDLAEQGVRTVHRCPEPVDEVQLEITMLHDVNPAYRTFALAERETPGPLAIFSVEQPEHTVDVTELDAAGSGGISPTEQAGIAGTLLAVVLGGVWGFRRLTRPRSSTAGPTATGEVVT